MWRHVEACGGACIAHSCNDYSTWGGLIGHGHHSRARVCPLPGGRTDRQGSDESWQVGHEASYRGRPHRCAAGGDHLRLHCARLQAARRSNRRHPAVASAGQASWATTPTSGEASRRQGLRLSALSAGVAQALRRRGIIPRIARRGSESRERLGRYRWVVERTLSWLNRFRRLKVRYERRADIHQAFLSLPSAAPSSAGDGRPLADLCRQARLGAHSCSKML